MKILQICYINSNFNHHNKRLLDAFCKAEEELCEFEAYHKEKVKINVEKEKLSVYNLRDSIIGLLTRYPYSSYVETSRMVYFDYQICSEGIERLEFVKKELSSRKFKLNNEGYPLSEEEIYFEKDTIANIEKFIFEIEKAFYDFKFEIYGEVDFKSLSFQTHCWEMKKEDNKKTNESIPSFETLDESFYEETELLVKKMEELLNQVVNKPIKELLDCDVYKIIKTFTNEENEKVIVVNPRKKWREKLLGLIEKRVDSIANIDYTDTVDKMSLEGKYMEDTFDNFWLGKKKLFLKKDFIKHYLSDIDNLLEDGKNFLNVQINKILEGDKTLLYKLLYESEGSKKKHEELIKEIDKLELDFYIKPLFASKVITFLNEKITIEKGKKVVKVINEDVLSSEKSMLNESDKKPQELVVDEICMICFYERSGCSEILEDLDTTFGKLSKKHKRSTNNIKNTYYKLSDKSNRIYDIRPGRLKHFKRVLEILENNNLAYQKCLSDFEDFKLKYVEKYPNKTL